MSVCVLCVCVCACTWCLCIIIIVSIDSLILQCNMVSGNWFLICSHEYQMVTMATMLKCKHVGVDERYIP